MEGILVLTRHGESEWNARNVWTGLTDVGLTQKGKEEAARAASFLTDISFDCAFTSLLSRAQETLQIILNKLNKSTISITTNAALNERDYGVYTGKNKLEIKKALGDSEFLKLRRGWNYPIEHGESLAQVYTRVVPFVNEAILPLCQQGKRVLVVAHGNSLRAVIKYLDHISDEDISGVELATGEMFIYRIDEWGHVVSRESRGSHA